MNNAPGPSRRLADRTVVVTGASSGMGRAMATGFVAEGARVVFSSNDPDRLEATVEDLGPDAADRAADVPADVRSWDDVRALVRDATDRFGAIDVWVNNAGVTQLHTDPDHVRRHVVDLPVASWDAVVDTNLRGPFLCSKAVLPGMLERGRGRLLHVSSSHGFRGRAGRAPYAASKFGLEGFHESLALELDGTGVDSIAVRPPAGGVYSERFGEIGREPDSFAFESPDLIVETAVRLAAGGGENGGRYVADPDGGGFSAYARDGPS